MSSSFVPLAEGSFGPFAPFETAGMGYEASDGTAGSGAGSTGPPACFKLTEFGSGAGPCCSSQAAGAGPASKASGLRPAAGPANVEAAGGGGLAGAGGSRDQCGGRRSGQRRG